MGVKIPIPVRIEEAKAVSDEIRLFILDLLTKKPMSVNEIAEELKKRGMFKNINTVRYHIQVLKQAGLIELVRTEEIKGGVLKYYASRRKVYTYEVPKDIEKDLEPIIKDMEPALTELLKNIIDEHKDLIERVSKRLKPCPYCVTKHFAEYILMESLRMATAKSLGKKEIKKRLSEFDKE